MELKNPCDSTIVKTIKETAKRVLAKPVKKKFPMSPHILKKLKKKLSKGNDLLHMRTLTLALIAYAGFLRFDEVHRIRREHICFLKTHMKIFLPSSKPDQYNAGDYVYIARTGNETCPYENLKKYLKTACISNDDKVHIFRGITRTKNGCYMRKADVPISYGQVRETVLKEIAGIGLDRKMFGTHSLRRGGATHACRAGISDRLFKKHGRWRSENAKDGYVSEDLDTKLSVSRSLGI